MKMLKKIIAGSVVILLILVMGGFVIHKSVVSWRWNNVASASGSMPFQVGIAKAIVIPCTTSGTNCIGGTMCNTVTDPANCELYEDVSGASAGGTGQPPLLLSVIAIGQAGLASGKDLIYGGTTSSMLLSQDASLASVGGCYGSACTAKAGATNKIFAWLEKIDKFIIAGFRGK